MPISAALARLRARLAPTLSSPPALAFLPALCLAAFWIGGEPALLLVSLGLPLLLAVAGTLLPNARNGLDAASGLLRRDGFEGALGRALGDCRKGELQSACFVLQIEDYGTLPGRADLATMDRLTATLAERIRGLLRPGDLAARLGDGRFALCLAPTHHLDLELCVQFAGHLMAAIEEPYLVGEVPTRLSCSIGFCQSACAPGQTGQDWLAAAGTALATAQQVGPASVRAYAPDRRAAPSPRGDLQDAVAGAIEKGQIQPWYQPQVSTDTGQVSGFEALARWIHPEHGMIPPEDFLPALERAGLLERLGQVILYHALTALKAWDNAGLNIPCVAVNFSTEELRAPGLVERIRWDLDRFELPAERLCIEILETVFTDCAADDDPGEDRLAANIRGLAALGCRIDLDDFGTGHASIASIRRFAISRIKIDRSFVMRADQDPEQQRMVAAILTMAERLEVETLAEGVETVGEHALLAQLGCTYVQGYVIGRPMPFDQTLAWVADHRAKLVDTPVIRRSAG